MIGELIVSGLERLRRLLYRGPVKKVVAAVGLESVLKTTYSSLLSAASTDNTVTQEINGTEAKFHVSTGMEVQRFRGLMSESEVVESVLEEVEPEDVFYDVGANVGMYTCFVSQKVNTSVAFEPHPENRMRLRENIELNGLENAVVRQEALSDEDGKTHLAIHGADVAGEGTHSLATEEDGTTVEIETARADSLVNTGSCPSPDVVKIDVEGAELSVLQGMKNSLEDCRAVYCEVHSERVTEYGGTVDEIYELLESHDFSIESLEERGSEEFLRAKRD